MPQTQCAFVTGAQKCALPVFFAAVGATLPFNRLVESVLALKAAGEIPEDVVLQVGRDAKRPPSIPGVEIVDTLPFAKVQKLLHDAEIVVCHGGTGYLLTALRAEIGRAACRETGCQSGKISGVSGSIKK